MRLGELKNIIDAAVTEDNHLIYDVKDLYNGNRFQISGYSGLFKALKQLSKQEWVKSDTSILDELDEEYYDTTQVVEISPEENNKLQALVNEINKRLPLYHGILESYVSEQAPNIVNIKLPTETLKDFKSLNKFNSDIQKVFDLIVKYKGFNGEIKFAGFDKGSDWYEIILKGGPIVYAGFMGCIKIAEKLINLRSEWYKSEEVKIDVEIKKEKLSQLQEAKKKQALEVTKADIEEHIEEKFKKHLRVEINKLLTQLFAESLENEQSSNNENEVENSIFLGLQKMIELLEKGTEFHPSLNPPEYVKEDEKGFIKVDYKKLKELTEVKQKPEQIEDLTVKQQETIEGGEDAS